MESTLEKSRSIRRFDCIVILRRIAILAVVAAHYLMQVPTLASMTVAMFTFGEMGVQLFCGFRTHSVPIYKLAR